MQRKTARMTRGDKKSARKICRDQLVRSGGIVRMAPYLETDRPSMSRSIRSPQPLLNCGWWKKVPPSVPVDSVFAGEAKPSDPDLAVEFSVTPTSETDSLKHPKIDNNKYSSLLQCIFDAPNDTVIAPACETF